MEKRSSITGKDRHAYLLRHFSPARLFTRWEKGLALWDAALVVELLQTVELA